MRACLLPATQMFPPYTCCLSPSRETGSAHGLMATQPLTAAAASVRRVLWWLRSGSYRRNHRDAVSASSLELTAPGLACRFSVALEERGLPLRRRHHTPRTGPGQNHQPGHRNRKVLLPVWVDSRRKHRSSSFNEIFNIRGKPNVIYLCINCVLV